MLAAISYDPIVRIGIGPLEMSPHGIGIAVGFLLGARLMMPAAERKGIDPDDVYSLLTRAAIGSIIGARLAYVLNHIGDYDSILDALKVWEGGISLLGGFVGAILAALPAMKAKGLSFWKVMDAAAPGMALGVIVGRLGDVIVGDHFGKTIDGDFVLGYKCPPLSVETASTCGGPPGGLNVPGAIVHQPHLYDMILTIVLLFVLLRLRRTPRYDGFLILVFGAAYGFNRFVEDWFRIDETHGLGLTGSQWTALVSMVVCLYVLVVRRQTPAWGRWDEGTGGAAAHDREGDVPGAEAEAPTMTAPPPADREE